MPVLLRREIWTQQPRFALPLAPEFAAWQALADCRRRAALIGTWYDQGNASQVVTPEGVFFQAQGGVAMFYAQARDASNNPSITAVANVVFSAPDAEKRLLAVASNTSVNACYITADAAGVLRLYWNNTLAITGPTVSAGKVLNIGIAGKNGEQKLCVNGVEYAGSVAANVGWVNYIKIDSQNFYPAYIGQAGIIGWTNAYLPEVARRLSANPWQVFAPRKRVIVFAADSGGDLSASASGAAQASGTATPALQVALAGIGIGAAGGSAADQVAIPLAAAGFAVSSGNATQVATVTLGAAGLAQAAASAGLSRSVLLQGAAAATASGNAALAAQLTLLASGAAQAGGTAAPSLSGAGQLAAGGAATAAGVAALALTVALQATGGAQAAGAANLGGGNNQALGGTGSAQSAGAATVQATIALTAAGFVQAMGAGQLVMQAPLAAFGAAQAAGQAALQVQGTLLPLAFVAGMPIRVATLACVPARAARLTAGVTRIGATPHA